MERIFLLEDNLQQRKIIGNCCRQRINRQFKHYTLCVIESFAHFYRNLEIADISSNDIYLIDYDLNTFFNGIDIAEKLIEQNAEVKLIFITGDPGAAVEVINKNIRPLGYLLKQGQGLDGLNQELHQLVANLHQTNQVMASNGNKIPIKTRSVAYYYDLYELNYIETDPSQRHVLRIHLTGNKIVKVKKRFKERKEELAPFPELMIFKSVIINMRTIKIINRQDEYILFDDEELLFLGKKIIDQVRKFTKSEAMEGSA